MSRLAEFRTALNWAPTGLRPLRAIDWSRVQRLHFVCKGNICRSVYGEYRARRMGIAACSSGTAAATDHAADLKAHEAAARHGLSLDAHKTRRFADVEVLPGDLLVMMEPWQVTAVTARARSAGAQMTLMGLWGNTRHITVRDPYGRDAATFDECFGIIDSAVSGLISQLNGARAVQSSAGRQSAPADSNARRTAARELRFGRRVVKTVLGVVLFTLRLHQLVLRKRAVIVAFHSVVPDGNGDPLRTPVAAFERYCRFFSKHFAVVPLHELVRRLRAGEPIGGLLAVTFDDGYADNAQLAAPLLGKYGISATFFVATDFIGSCKSAPWDERKGVRSQWMTWDEVASLADQGHDIEIHTMSHAEISDLDDAALSHELIYSAVSIERHTHKTPRLFAVPFGRPTSLTPRVLDCIARRDIVATVIADGGIVTQKSSPTKLNRFPMNYADAQSPYEVGVDILRDAISIDRKHNSTWRHR